jgi:ribosomal protein L9
MAKKLTVTAKDIKEYGRLSKSLEKDNIDSNLISQALNGNHEVYLYQLTDKDIEGLKKNGFKVKKQTDPYEDFEDTGDTDVEGRKLFREVEKEDVYWIVSW